MDAALTAVSANCDYHRFREELERIDANIRASHVEAMAVEFALETLPAKARAVAFGVLAHNLWWIARKIREREKESRLQAA